MHSWQLSRIVQGRFPAWIQALAVSHKWDGDECACSGNDRGTERMFLFMKQRHLESRETPVQRQRVEIMSSS